MLLLLQTSDGCLLYYKLGVIAEQKGLYEQIDSPNPNLRRDSAELYIKEVIPPLHLTLVNIIYVIYWYGKESEKVVNYLKLKLDIAIKKFLKYLKLFGVLTPLLQEIVLSFVPVYDTELYCLMAGSIGVLIQHCIVI